jgi:hypothetical protein
LPILKTSQSSAINAEKTYRLLYADRCFQPHRQQQDKQARRVSALAVCSAKVSQSGYETLTTDMIALRPVSINEAGTKPYVEIGESCLEK